MSEEPQNAGTANKFCSVSNLRNESDVEQFFVAPLLGELGFTADYLQTKRTVIARQIGKGKRRRSYIPDYVGYLTSTQSRPVLVVDAKGPDRDADEGVDDAQLYASVIRRGIASPKPEQYCVGINGQTCIVKHFDSDQELHRLSFADFVDGNHRFEAFKAQLSRAALAATMSTTVANEPFEFRKVTPNDLPSIFEACHRKIRKAEKRHPAPAFYEFSKLMYIKIDEDRQVRSRMGADVLDLASSDGMVPRSSVHFSSHWILDMEEGGSENPVNAVLFAGLVDRLEEQISRREKKRIFDEHEGIALSPSTIKEVVKLLEHLDLGAVDEDLNGRMFETFLTATMRGKDLGQFFTTRSVVKFMVELVGLQATRNRMDTVLDGCCGSGGFLIEAMADMSNQIAGNTSLSPLEQEDLMSRLRKEALWGVDAGTDPQIARIARLNMLLHRDGGSRIYQGDLLDKKLLIEPGTSLDLRLETEELQTGLLGSTPQKFSVVLTNPPFSMNYERKDPAEARVLSEYLLSANDEGKAVSSLKSSVMFIERYWELLEGQGRLVTVMDDSVLNTATDQFVRGFIREKFVIKAIIGLPKNAFVKAESSVSTSVLYLRKKTNPAEQQPAIYMALCANVGHSDSGKDRPEWNQLPLLLDEYRQYEETGTLPDAHLGFIVQSSESDEGNTTRRLDAAYFNPDYFATLARLDEMSTERGWEVIVLNNLLETSNQKGALTGGATPLGARYPDYGPKFIRVQNVRPNRLEWSLESDACIPTDIHNGQLSRSQLQAGDVVFTITGSYGNAAVVPDNFAPANINQHSVRIRVDRSRVKPDYLAAFLNSSLCRPQMDRAATGSSRPALDYRSVRQLRILVPSLAEQDEIIKEVTAKIEDLRHLESRLSTIGDEMQSILESP